MHEDNYSDEDNGSEDQLSVSSIVNRFENFKIPNQLDRLIRPKIANKNEYKDVNKNLQRNIVQDDENNASCEKPEISEFIGEYEKTPVPSKREILPSTSPTSTIKISAKNANVKRNSDVESLPSETDEIRSVDDFKKPNNVKPIARTRTMVRRDLNITASHTVLNEQRSDESEALIEQSDVPSSRPRYSNNSTRKLISYEDPGIRNQYIMSKGLHRSKTIRYPPVNKAASCLDLSELQFTFSENLSERSNALLRLQKGSTFVNKVPLQEDPNKGAVKKPQIISSQSKATFKPLNNSTSHTRIIENYRYLDAPPLPPKSLAMKQSMAHRSNLLSPSPSPSFHNKPYFKRSSVAVQKLKELKSIYASTSTGKSDKYVTSLLLLIDVMVEAIQEKTSDDEENDSNENDESAWYGNIKDFVRGETTEYIRENQLLENNPDIPYDKLLGKMMPKFIENYVTSDDDNHTDSHSDEEEEYEPFNSEKETEKTQYIVTIDQMKNSINETIKTEKKHYVMLVNYIHTLNENVQSLPSEEDFLTEMGPILNSLKMAQNYFMNQLEKSGDNLLLILKTFLDCKYLFELYGTFFTAKVKIIDGKPTLHKKVDDLKITHVSQLLFSKLLMYKHFVKSILQQIKQNTKLNELTEEVIEVLNHAVEICSKAVKTSAASNRHLESDIGPKSLIRESQGITQFLANLIPATTYDTSLYGLFLLKDYFRVDDDKNYLAVFLFQKVIFLTKKESKDKFIYKDFIRLNDLVLLSEETNKKILKFKDYPKSKLSGKDVIIKLEAKSKKIQNSWRKEIKKCLWGQFIKQQEESEAKRGRRLI